MTGLNTYFRRFCAFGAGISMSLVFAIIFFNSLRRYTVGKSVEWGEELPIYLTIYGVMFGIAMAYMQDRHIRFTILTDFIPAALREKLFAAVDLVMVVTGGTLAWSGYLFATRRGTVEASGLVGTAKGLAESTGIEGLVWLGRMGSYQAAVSLGAVLIAIAALLQFEQRVRKIRGL